MTAPDGTRLPKSASTAVYLNRDGERYAVFHQAKSAAWQHDYDGAAFRACPVCCTRPAPRTAKRNRRAA